jgi:hypothetical protein
MSYHSEIGKAKSASLLEFLITITLAIAFLIYFSIASYTKDFLWFWPVFNSQPVSALIRCYGQEIYLERNPADLKAIADMVNKQLSDQKRWDELNLTDQTLEEYQSSSQMMILELFYDGPQRLHTSSPFFSSFDSLLIPLDGRYADTSIVFALISGKPGGSSYHVQSFQPVADYLAQRKICVKS